LAPGLVLTWTFFLKTSVDVDKKMLAMHSNLVEPEVTDLICPDFEPDAFLEAMSFLAGTEPSFIFQHEFALEYGGTVT
jgi:hypothetical protein